MGSWLQWPEEKNNEGKKEMVQRNNSKKRGESTQVKTQITEQWSMGQAVTGHHFDFEMQS